MVNEIDKSNLEYADKPINTIFLKKDLDYYNEKNEKNEKESFYKKNTLIHYVDYIKYSSNYADIHLYDEDSKQWVLRKFKESDWIELIKNEIQISFDSNVIHFIKEIMPRKNMEFECRFGLKDKNFNPRITKSQFSNLLDFLKNQPFSYTFEKSTVKIYDNNVREIIDSSNNKKFELKRRVKYQDSEYTDFTLRFSLSEEKQVSSSYIGYDVVEVRDRIRHTYKYKDLFEYSLTKIKSKQSDSEYYEFEIEYNFQNITIEDIKFSIKNVLKFLISDVDNPIYIPVNEQKRIRYIFKENEIIETKPINLPRRVAQDLYSLDYSVTNKLDGERFYIFFNLEGVYAINRRKVRKLSNEIFLGMAISVFDAEYFEGIYYIFDCLIIQGDSLIHTKEHEDRIDFANTFEKSFRYVMPGVFKVKVFERMDKKTDTMQYYAKKILNKDRINNDGLIFTPPDFLTDMSPIYKWKYPEKMSIDFMVHKIKKKDGLNTYDLNVKGDGGKIYPYILDYTTPAIYETTEELKERGIYEFTYNLEEKKFKLLRERTDKTDPNYITVADNVWEDMKNPFTEKELLELLLPPPLRTYRLYQNSIKKDLINKYCQNASVLDLGSGRGGDLGKYDKSNVSQLWCVEPYEKNYQELLQRLEERKNMLNKTKLIVATAQETDKIVNVIRDTYNVVNVLYEDKMIGKDFRDWFPRKKGVDYSKLKISDEGLYSMTKEKDSELIINSMKSIIGESLSGYTITDATANVGGDSIRFAMNFKSVNSVELDKNNYEILKNNLSVYNFNNVSTYNYDIVKKWDDLSKNTDILFIDPPWGGKDYMKEESINLFLGDLSLNNFIGRDVLLNPNRPYYIFLKVPFNYSIDFIKNLPNVYDVQIFKIRKFNLICLCVDNKENPLKKATVISSFMSLSFFFNKDENGNYNDLDKLVTTIAKNLQNGGHFIGTTIDGEATLNMLKDMPENKLEYESGYIRLIDYEKYGKDSMVEIKMEEGIVEVQQEYLVNFNELQKRLSSYNISLVSSKFFNIPRKKSGQLLSLISKKESEAKLNSLYRTFVFIKNAPENLLYTRIIKKLTDESEKENLFAKLSLDSYESDIKFLDMPSEEEIIRNKCLKLFNDLCSNISYYKDKNYTFDFEYIDENGKYKKYNLDGKINHLDTQLKAYNNGKKLDRINLINILKTYAIIKIDSKTKESLLITERVKNKVDFKDVLLSNNYQIIVSCLYQLYFTIYCMLENGIYPVDPVIEIEINPNIKDINYPYNLGTINVIDGYIVKVSNFGISTKYRFKPIEMVDVPTELSIEYLDIITKMPEPFKKFIYNQLDSKSLFFKHILDFESFYNTKQMIAIRISNFGTNNMKNIKIKKHLSIKDEIEKDINRLDLLSDEEYLYYKKALKFFKTKGNPIEELLNKYYKNSNKRIMYVSDSKDDINIYNYNIVDSKPDVYIFNTKNHNISSKQNIKNILNSVSNIKFGGSVIVKITSYFSVNEISLISQLSECFETVDIVKPISSSITKSEVFILCNNYKKIIDVKDNTKNEISDLTYLNILASSYLIYGRQLYLSDMAYKSFQSLYQIDSNIDFVTRYNVSAIGFSKYFYRFVKNIRDYIEQKDSDAQEDIYEQDIEEKDDKKDKITRELNGIKNIGNTCYMNSVLQSLSNLIEIQEHFCNEKMILSKNQIVSSFSSIICELTKKYKKEIDDSLVKRFKSYITKEYPQYRKGQHDADEFMNVLLNILHNSLNTKDGKDIRINYNQSLTLEKNIENALEEYHSHNNSIISDLFTYLWLSSLECKKCKNKRSYIENSFNYGYNIKNSTFKLEPITETLSDDNKVYCEVCRTKTDHKKTLEVVKYPKICIVTLVRFKGKSKNDELVNYPFEIMDKNLISVINHFGSTGGGHYTCYGRNGKYEWFEYDDSNVDKIDDKKVVSKNGYILIYS